MLCADHERPYFHQFAKEATNAPAQFYSIGFIRKRSMPPTNPVRPPRLTTLHE